MKQKYCLNNISYTELLFSMRKLLKRHKVKYMLIGNISFIMQGLVTTAKEIDIIIKNENENLENLLLAFYELGLCNKENLKLDLLKNKEIYRIHSPVKINIFLGLPGKLTFKNISKHKKSIRGFKCLSLDGSIALYSQISTMRTRYLLQILKDFQEFNKNGFPKISDYDSTFMVPDGYSITDIETIKKWNENKRKSFKTRLSEGINVNNLKLEDNIEL